MVRRLCEKHGIETRKIWGNHDGIFIKSGSQWYIGEALGSGNKMTPISAYEKSISTGKEEMKIYRVIPNDEYDDAEEIGEQAADNWLAHIHGRGYDYRGLFYLWIKSIFPFVKRMREWEFADWCTEGGNSAFRDWAPPLFNLLQTKYPTPMTVEQCAGELPHKPEKRITLTEVTSQILKTASKNDD